MKRKIKKSKKFNKYTAMKHNSSITVKEFFKQLYEVGENSLEWWEDDNTLTM